MTPHATHAANIKEINASDNTLDKYDIQRAMPREYSSRPSKQYDFESYRRAAHPTAGEDRIDRTEDEEAAEKVREIYRVHDAYFSSGTVLAASGTRKPPPDPLNVIICLTVLVKRPRVPP